MKALLCLLLLPILAFAAVPTKFEQGIYQIETNWTQQISAVGQMDTNRMVTNVAYVTNMVEGHKFKDVRPEVKAAIEDASKAAESTGLPTGAISNLIMAVLTIFAWFRNTVNKKRADTSDKLANEYKGVAEVFAKNIETGREVIKKVASPPVEAHFVEHIKSKQAEAGVKPLASAISTNSVSVTEAKEAANKITTP